MTTVFIVLALAVAGAYVVLRAVRGSSARGVDLGTLSTHWIAEHRREEPR